MSFTVATGKKTVRVSILISLVAVLGLAVVSWTGSTRLRHQVLGEILLRTTSAGQHLEYFDALGSGQAGQIDRIAGVLLGPGSGCLYVFLLDPSEKVIRSWVSGVEQGIPETGMIAGRQAVDMPLFRIPVLPDPAVSVVRGTLVRDLPAIGVETSRQGDGVIEVTFALGRGGKGHGKLTAGFLEKAVFCESKALGWWGLGAALLALVAGLTSLWLLVRQDNPVSEIMGVLPGAPASRDGGVPQDTDRVQEIACRMILAQKSGLTGILAGGIAHNLNNLLMAIHGNAGLLRSSLGPADPGIKKLDRILEVVNTAAGVIRELMVLARTDTVSRTRTHLNDVVTVCLDLFVRTRKELEITRAMDKDLWRVHGDRIELEQVFLNLLVNASQAMPKAGSLTVTTANVVQEPDPNSPRDLAPGRYAMVSIQDSGEGMDRATLETMFEPFFTTRPRGAGMGLAFVHRTVTELGGFVRATSTPGSGTTVTVYLPALAKKETPDA